MASLTEYSPSSNKIIHNVSADFISRTNMPQPVHIVQGDISLPIIAVTLYKNGQLYDIPAGVSGNVRWEKPNPSASYVYNPLLGLDHDRHVVYFEVTQQMASVFGKTRAIIEILDGNSARVGSAPIFIDIDRDPIQPGDVEDTSEYKTLLEYVAEAEDSATRAKDSEEKAKTSEDHAKESEENAKKSEDNAKTSEENAAVSAEAAKESENNAKTSEENAAASAEASENYSKWSQSYAVGGTKLRPKEDTDCAKYYYTRAMEVVEGIAGGFFPIGTVSFEDLTVVEKETGFMYDISNAFTTDETFKEGPGHEYPAGTNVYWTKDGFWDALAGPVMFRSWDIAISAESWVEGTDSFLGISANWQQTIPLEGITEEIILSIDKSSGFVSGDYAAACDVQWYIRPGTGAITVWAPEKTTGDFVIRLTEVPAVSKNGMGAITNLPVVNPFFNRVSQLVGNGIKIFGNITGDDSPFLHLQNMSGTKNVDMYVFDSNSKFPSFHVYGSGYGNKYFDMLNLVYPVGVYYWSSDPTSPASLFGGSWVQITDRFVLAAGSTYAVNTTGGAATHSHGPGSYTAQITTAGAAFIFYYQNTETYAANYGLHIPNGSVSGAGTTKSDGTRVAGTSSVSNNMPPYIVAYCWRRTA